MSENSGVGLYRFHCTYKIFLALKIKFAKVHLKVLIKYKNKNLLSGEKFCLILYDLIIKITDISKYSGV